MKLTANLTSTTKTSAGLLQVSTDAVRDRDKVAF